MNYREEQSGEKQPQRAEVVDLDARRANRRGNQDLTDQEDAGGRDPPSFPPSDRKFKAKRLNEHIKAFYSLMNTLGAAVIGAAYILPTIRHESGPNEPDRPGWVLIGLSLHIFGQIVIRLGLRRED